MQRLKWAFLVLSLITAFIVIMVTSFFMLVCLSVGDSFKECAADAPGMFLY